MMAFSQVGKIYAWETICVRYNAMGECEGIEMALDQRLKYELRLETRSRGHVVARLSSALFCLSCAILALHHVNPF